MVSDKYPPNQIERLTALEDKLGLELGAVSAIVTAEGEGFVINVLGEVLAPGGLMNDISVVATLYDDVGDIVGTDHTYCSRERFAGFDTFSVLFIDCPVVPVRIRVYPRAR